MNILPQLSVVICSYNRERFIIEAVNSITLQQYPIDRYEIIVVDNNSTDQTLLRLRDYSKSNPQIPLRVLVETNQGVAYARSRGAKEAKGKIVAYLDDDCKALPNWLQLQEKYYTDCPEVYSIGGKITPYYLTPKPKWFSKYFFGLVGLFDQGDNIKFLKGQRYPCGANMSFRKAVFDELGYFNPDLGRKGTGLVATEEKEMYLRIIAAGKKVLYVPEIEVLHAVESNKFDELYVRKHSIGIGAGERIRLKNQPWALCKKLLEYKAKWAYAVLYGMGFLLKGEWSKFVMLERFRFWVIVGFLFPHKAN